MAYKNVVSLHGRGFRAERSAEDKAETFRRAHPWATFLGGKWSKDRPREPGYYPIATRAGAFAGYREFIKRGDQIVDKTAGPNEPGWQGWIWTESIPPSPPAPEWG